MTDVWDDLVGPEEAPAMRLRSRLLRALNKQIRSWGQNPEVICQKLYISYNELDGIFQGHIDKFSYDELVALCFRADLDIEPILQEHLSK